MGCACFACFLFAKKGRKNSRFCKSIFSYLLVRRSGMTELQLGQSCTKAIASLLQKYSGVMNSFIIMCAMLCYWGLDLQLYRIKNVGEIKNPRNSCFRIQSTQDLYQRCIDCLD
jgi:hypothetical protein